MAYTKAISKNQTRSGLVNMDQSATATKIKEIRNEIMNCTSNLLLKILTYSYLIKSKIPTVMGICIASLNFSWHLQ